MERYIITTFNYIQRDYLHCYYESCVN